MPDGAKKRTPTPEQLAAIESGGRVIVSASAGSGKTFVMIEKLARAIEAGADLDDVLAVTFTRKAAAQMKDKLRAALIRRVENAPAPAKARLKAQIAKIPSAEISTIHSFCARLLRTYFFAAGIDGGFEIISDDDAVAKELKERALDNLFEKKYAENDGQFLHLLKRFMKKRSDGSLKRLVLESYSKVRTVAHYGELLAKCKDLYTDEGFAAVCADLSEIFAEKYGAVYRSVEEFAASFPRTSGEATYKKIFSEMLEACRLSAEGGAFGKAYPLAVTAKPRDGEGDEKAGEAFKNFRKRVADAYNGIREGLASEAEEREAFLKSGETAVAFCGLLSAFDAEYSAVKRDENKLDYNDLEHLTLGLLSDDAIRKEICASLKYVFVDEYQDVNPVQEEIVSSIGSEVFLVGDVKQAIYGFRGSRSLFFAEKYNAFEGGGGTALRLSDNFRSCGKVLSFVNSLFSEAMNSAVCGFDYSKNSKMNAGGAYPDDAGFAGIHVFGKDEREREALSVYSVKEDGKQAGHTREGLAVLSVVEKELRSKIFDLGTGEYRDVQTGDICILTRKNKGDSTEGIIRALRDAGYPVSGAQEPNICALPEVKQTLDILSVIDNAEQDVPLVSCMLSPFGKFTPDELASVRVAYKRQKRMPFRKCCRLYAGEMRSPLAQKLNTFYDKLEAYRDLAEVITAYELIFAVLSDSGLEAEYAAGDGQKLKNVERLASYGEKMTLPAFLAYVKAGGYNLAAPSNAPSDSIKIMSMHAAKGLEFPVVIISDICRTFKGSDAGELLFDEKYLFAPKLYDPENMLVRSTVLRRLVKLRADREELKNELNLFYVACTRAMCDLHIMAESVTEYSPLAALSARSYSQTFDMSRFKADEIAPAAEFAGGSASPALAGSADPRLAEEIESRFMRGYPHAESVDLPVKSSASAILKNMQEDEPYEARHYLFGGEGETGTERGTAYHRFLELCDLTAADEETVSRELENFVASGALTSEQAALLDARELSQILSMPVFGGLEGAEIYREREFLCRLPACDVLGGSARDNVLVQGAIDLMAVSGGKVRIIDYKYSGKTDERLKETYSPQLALYKKAVSLITGCDPADISTCIVNIKLKTQIDL